MRHFIFAPGGHVLFINGNQLRWKCLSCIKCLDCLPRSLHLICTHTRTQSLCRELGDALFRLFHITCLRGCSNSGRRMTNMWKTPWVFDKYWQIYVDCCLQSGCNFHVWLVDNPKEEVSIHTKPFSGDRKDRIAAVKACIDGGFGRRYN